MKQFLFPMILSIASVACASAASAQENCIVDVNFKTTIKRHDGAIETINQITKINKYNTALCLKGGGFEGRITHISENIKECINLQYLDFSQNTMPYVPNGITQLPNLQYLILSNGLQVFDLSKQVKLSKTLSINIDWNKDLETIYLNKENTYKFVAPIEFDASSISCDNDLRKFSDVFKRNVIGKQKIRFHNISGYLKNAYGFSGNGIYLDINSNVPLHRVNVFYLHTDVNDNNKTCKKDEKQKFLVDYDDRTCKKDQKQKFLDDILRIVTKNSIDMSSPHNS